MDNLINNIDTTAVQILCSFVEHNKIFTLILVLIAAVVLLLIKKIIAVPCNIFTGRVNTTKLMLSEWAKDISIYADCGYKFTDDVGKNILFNRLAERVLSAYYQWKKQDYDNLRKRKINVDEVSSLEYQTAKLGEIRKKWKAAFWAWCKVQKIPDDKAAHIIKVYEKIVSGELKAIKLMLSRFAGNQQFINLLFHTMLNAITYDLESAAASFNGDLAGLKIEGHKIGKEHHAEH